MRVLVLNGPNLNLLGTREPEIYGTTTLTNLDRMVHDWGTELGLDIETQQSNHEGVLIDAIQRSELDGIVLNPAAYTHTSRAIADAIAAVPTPVVEVHISNIKEREPWRAESVVSDSCVRSIYGRGLSGYRDALRHLLNRATMSFETISYGPDNENVGDLRRGERGLVVLVHGGFWRREWERDSMESLAVDLTRRGFNTWNIEYRRLGDGGGWPGSFDDTLAALDSVPGLDLDVGPVAVVGHSAGGFLAMWAGQRSQTRVELVVAMATTADLGRHADADLYGAGEAGLLLEAGAPALADPGEVRTMLVHGEGDRHVPIVHSEDLASRHGLDLVSADTGHFQLLDPGRDHWVRVAEAIDSSI